jgi:hypothetical protein
MGERRTGGGSKRNLLLLVLGIAAGLLLNPATGPRARRWLKERLFGREHTFDYEA